MNRETIAAAAAGAALALVVFLAMGGGAWKGLRFRTGFFDREDAIQQARETVAVFNIYYARFLSSAGDVEGLNLFPADNLIKRRVIQEINSWKERGSALVFDKHALNITGVELLGPERAVVTTEERWALVLRETATGRKTSGVKILHGRYRYLVGGLGNAGKVLEYDVFNMQDPLPPVPESWKR